MSILQSICHLVLGHHYARFVTRGGAVVRRVVPNAMPLVLTHNFEWMDPAQPLTVIEPLTWDPAELPRS